MQKAIAIETYNCLLVVRSKEGRVWSRAGNKDCSLCHDIHIPSTFLSMFVSMDSTSHTLISVIIIVALLVTPSIIGIIDVVVEPFDIADLSSCPARHVFRNVLDHIISESFATADESSLYLNILHVLIEPVLYTVWNVFQSLHFPTRPPCGIVWD